MLPRPSDGPVSLTICGMFQLGSTLGTRNIFAEHTINAKDLSGDTHGKYGGDLLARCIKTSPVITVSVGNAESCASLLITIGRYFLHFETLPSREVRWCLSISCAN